MRYTKMVAVDKAVDTEVHAVEEGDYDPAICGAKPPSHSAGWSRQAGNTVTCLRCRSVLAGTAPRPTHYDDARLARGIALLVNLTATELSGGREWDDTDEALQDAAFDLLNKMETEDRIRRAKLLQRAGIDRQTAYAFVDL